MPTQVMRLFKAHDWKNLIPVVERAERPSCPPAHYWAVPLRGSAFTSAYLRYLKNTRNSGARSGSRNGLRRQKPLITT